MSLTTARNVAIVALLALAVYALPGGGTAGRVFGAALFVVLTLSLCLLAGRLYLEHRTGLHSLGDGYRGVLYGALGVAVLTLAGGPRLFTTGLGTLSWFVLMGLVSLGLYRVWRHAREL